MVEESKSTAPGSISKVLHFTTGGGVPEVPDKQALLYVTGVAQKPNDFQTTIFGLNLTSKECAQYGCVIADGPLDRWNQT